MPKKPFQGIHEACPDLSAAVPEMPDLPAIMSVVDAQVKRLEDTEMRDTDQWSPKVEDCTVTIEPGNVELCDGSKILVAPGGDEDPPTFEVDIFDNSKFWVEANAATGQAYWYGGDEMPPRRVNRYTVNIPIWEVGRTSTLSKVTADYVTDGYQVLNGRTRFVIRERLESEDEPDRFETQEDGIPLAVVDIVTDVMTGADKLSALLSEINASMTAAAAFPLGSTDYIYTISHTEDRIMGVPVTFSQNNIDHVLLLISSIAQLASDTVSGFLPGGCDEEQWSPGGGGDGGGTECCCTVEISPGEVVIDGIPILIKPRNVNICDERFVWLEVNNYSRIGVVSSDIGFPIRNLRAADSLDVFGANIPLFEAGNIETLKATTFYGLITAALVYVNGHTLRFYRNDDYGSYVGPTESTDDITYISLNDTTTGSAGANIIVGAIAERHRAVAILVEDEKLKGYSGKIMTMATSFDKDFIEITNITTYGDTDTVESEISFDCSDEVHCALLDMSIIKYETGPIETYQPIKQWRPYDTQIDGSTATSRFNGGTMTWTDGLRTLVGPYQSSSGGGGGGDVITLGPSANKLYLEINYYTHDCTWKLEEDILPVIAGDVVNWRVADIGLSSTITAEEVTENYADGDDLEVGEYKYVFSAPLNTDSASLGADEILVPIGATTMDTLGILAARITASSKTISAVAWQELSEDEESSKSYLVLVSTVDGETLPGGASPSEEADGYVLANSFKYPDGPVVNGPPTNKRRKQFFATNSGGDAMGINISTGWANYPYGAVIEDDNGYLKSFPIAPDDSDDDRFNVEEIISADNNHYWLEVQIYPQHLPTATNKGVVCNKGTEFPSPRTGGLSSISNNIPLLETVRVGSLAKYKYTGLPADGDTITFGSGDNEVTYTFAETVTPGSDEVRIGGDAHSLYDKVAFMLSSRGIYAAANFPLENSTASPPEQQGYILAGDYSSDTTAYSGASIDLTGDTEASAETVSAFFKGTLRNLCQEDPIMLCDKEDYDLQSFKCIPTGAVDQVLMLPGRVTFWEDGSSTVLDVPAAILTVPTALQINIETKSAVRVGLTEARLNGSEDTSTSKFVPIAGKIEDSGNFTYGNIIQYHVGDIISANAILPAPDEPERDHFLVWKGSTEKMVWLPAPSETKDCLIYFHDDDISFLETGVTDKRKVISVDPTGDLQIDWPRVDDTV